MRRGRSTRSRSASAIAMNSSSDAGGASGVWLRVRMRNCAVLSFSTTVRPTRSVLRVAAQVFAASSRMAGSSSSRRRSRANVSSDEIDCTGWSVSTGRSSMPCARSCRRAPKLPNRACSVATSTPRRSPTVFTPMASSFCCATLPTPGMHPTGSGVRKSCTWCGRMTNSPSGLFQSDAIFARNLLGATPADAVNASSSRICARMVCATSVALARPSLLMVTSR